MTIRIDDNKIDDVVLDQLHEIIKNQYINFNNLGSDLLNYITDPYKQLILERLLEYYSNHYSPLALELHDTVDLGHKIYQFICLDFYNTILPSFLESKKLQNYIQFEKYINNRLNNLEYVKTEFIKIIQEIISKFNNLEKLDKFISQDQKFINIVNKYTFYQLLFNNIDIKMFLENYILPMFAKNEDEILWKI